MLADAWEQVESADLLDEHGDVFAGAEAIVALGGFDRFSGAYDATADGPVDEAVSGLRTSLAELDALHARAAQAPRLRPAHAVWRAIDGVLAAFEDVRDTYLEALTAATIDRGRAGRCARASGD